MKGTIFKKKEYDYNLFTILVVIYLGNISSICVWNNARLQITEGKSDATTIIQFLSFSLFRFVNIFPEINAQR